MVDISEELAVINNSKIGKSIKKAIVDALDKIAQADPNNYLDYDISPSLDFGWGTVDFTIGIAEEVRV